MESDPRWEVERKEDGSLGWRMRRVVLEGEERDMEELMALMENDPRWLMQWNNDGNLEVKRSGYEGKRNVT